MTEDPKDIFPRKTGVILEDGTPAWVLLLRGGGFADPNRPIIGGGKWNYRGLWSPPVVPPATTPYMTFDVVQLGAGTAAGMYFSTIDNNANAPDSGIGWMQVSSSAGAWI